MRETTGTVTENRTGGQIYLTGRFAQDTTFPLEIGGEFRAITAPFDAVVLFPEDADLSFPVELTVPDPEADLREHLTEEATDD